MQSLMCFVLLLAAAAEAAPTCSAGLNDPSCSVGLSEKSSSLLAFRSELGGRAMVSADLVYEVSSWRSSHSKLTDASEEAKDALDDFIQAQGESDDACSARLLESKRSLDGLLHDLKSLSLQVEDHETVLEVESKNLNISKMSIEAVVETHHEATERCEAERAQAIEELTQYTAELEELNQIAKPEVRYTEAVKVEMPGKQAEPRREVHTRPAATEPVAIEAVTEAPTALLEQQVWSKESCEAFVTFAKAHKSELLMKGTPRKAPLDCDKQRKELQKAYSKAYLAVKDLKKDAKERSEDNTCQETADAQRAAELVPLVAQRDQAAARIEYSEQALAALEPVLKLVEERSNKLQKHIDGTLTPECDEAGSASKYLQAVRDLILSLENCPGRNDFTLKIPKPDDKASKYFQKCFDVSFGQICGTRMHEGGKKGNGQYVMTPATAKKACEELDQTMCNLKDLKVAIDEGVEWCAYGFVADKADSLYFPMQQNGKKGCGKKGLNGPTKKTYGGKGKGNAWCCTKNEKED